MKRMPMKKMPTKRTVTAVIGLACFGAANAMAADEYQLTYSKQELGSHQGVAALHERVLRTAKDICPSYFELRDLRRMRGCMQEVADDLLAKIDHPRLTSYHHGGAELRVAAARAAAGDNS